MFLVLMLVPSGPAHGQGDAAIDPACEKLLPVAAVAKASGQSDLKLIAYNPAVGAGGTCNYASGGQTMILLVTLDRSARPERFERYKKDRMYRKDQKPISGLGDEAFSSGETIVVARRGKTFVALSAFKKIDPKTAKIGKPYLTREQLIDLARKMLSGS